MTAPGMKAHLIAAGVTALAVPALAYGVFWLLPMGCNHRGDPAAYRWTCLLPILVGLVAPVVGGLMLGGAWLCRGVRSFVESRPILTILAVGLAGHLMMSGVYFLTLNSAYRIRFLGELLYIPQPILAVATAAAVYAATVLWLTSRTDV